MTAAWFFASWRWWKNWIAMLFFFPDRAERSCLLYPFPGFRRILLNHFWSCKRVYFETDLPGIFSKPWST